MLRVTFLLLAAAVSSSSGDDAAAASDHNNNNKEYDDSRRSACMATWNSSASSVDDAALLYMKSMNMSILSSDIIQFSYSEQANADYQQACEAPNNNGAWREITVAMDCQKKEVEGKGSRSSVDIYIRNGQCFPKNEECDHYVQNPVDFQLDMNALFGRTCTPRNDESLSETYKSLIGNKTLPESLLKSQAHFEDWSDQYHDDTKRRACQGAFSETFHRHESLEDEAFEHVRYTVTELFQADPVLIKRESYRGDDGQVIRYKKLCTEVAGGRFEVWNGTMDCLGIGLSNRGSRLTVLSENSATCFPSGMACDGYTVAEWKLDTMMGVGSYSCTVRETKDDGETLTVEEKEGSSEGMVVSPSISIGNTSNRASGKTRLRPLPLTIVLAGLGLVGLVVVMATISARRNRSEAAKTGGICHATEHCSEEDLELIEITAEIT